MQNVSTPIEECYECAKRLEYLEAESHRLRRSGKGQPGRTPILHQIQARVIEANGASAIGSAAEIGSTDLTGRGRHDIGPKDEDYELISCVQTIT